MPTIEQNEWVGRVLGVKLPGAETSPPGGLKERLAESVRALVDLKAEGSPELPQLFTALAAARDGLAGPDGPSLLGTLESLVALARSAARGRAARRENVRGIQYPKLLLDWRSAQAKALSTVQGLGAAILAMPEVQADPRFDRAKQAAAQLPTLIPDLGETLGDLLDKGINAGTDADIAAEALETIAAYRSNLAQASALARLETFAQTHAGGVSVLATLDSALAGIAAALSKAR